MITPFGAPFGTTVPLLTSVSMIDTVSDNDQNVNWPGSLQAGDVAICVNVAYPVLGASTPTPVTPTGFTSIYSHVTDIGGGSGLAQCVSKKVLTGTESGAIVGMNTGEIKSIVVVILRGNIPIATVSHSGWLGQETVNNPDPVALTASGIAAPAAAFGSVYGSDGGTDFVGLTHSWGEEIEYDNGSLGISLYDVDDTPIDQSFDMDYHGVNFIVGGWLEFAP